MQHIDDEDKILSPEDGAAMLRAWCETNPAVANSTVYQAVERLKALESLWSAWKAVGASGVGYDKSMPRAVKAMERADKALLQRSIQSARIALCVNDADVETLRSVEGVAVVRQMIEGDAAK